jgi:FtsH-binding integral membrane protein
MNPVSPDIPEHTAFRRGWETFEMANWSDPQFGAASPSSTTATGVAVDAGLRAHMLRVYNYMTSGILLTGIVALLVYNTTLADALISFGIDGVARPSGLGWLLGFATIGISLWLAFGLNRMSVGTAQLLFWAYAVLMGAFLSPIFFIYTGASIALTFFATAASFASLSLWGYTTRRDLSGWRTFLLMGLIGLIIATMLTMLFVPPGQEQTMSLVISAAGVLIFAGLTAYYTQSIKSIYFQVRGSAMEGKMAVFGALQLYVAFINMFLYLLRFLGNSRN